MYNNGYQNGYQNPQMNQQYSAPNYGPQNYSQPNNYNNIPSYYRPIRGIGYVGYNLLYAIPIIGFIMLIVNALSNDNINKRNYARSYFWAMLIGTIIALIIGLIIVVVGLATGSFNR